MEQFLIYLLKVNGLLIFFWIFYKLFLQKETFYTFNRFYFLGSTLMSFVLPLIYFTKIKEIIVPASNIQIDENNSTILNQSPEIIELKWYETIDWLLVIVILIAAISVIKIGIRIYKIIQLTKSIQKLEKHPTEKNIRITESEAHVYSFYKWIILPKKLLNSENCSVLIQHEKVHIKQKHTFDLVSLSFISDFFWFNPIIKLIIKDVKLNLEFLVDDEITKQENSYLYQKTLLNFNQNQTQNIITNAFNSSDLKKRILMLNTQKSKNMKKLKIALTAPVLLAFFGLFQIETVAQIKEMTQQNVIRIVKEDTENIPVYSVAEVEEMNGIEKNSDEFYVLINNKYGDKYFSKMKNTLKKEYNIDLDISEMKRNKKGELTSIKFKWNNGTQIYSALGSNELGFNPFHMHVTKTNNKYAIEDFISATNGPLYIVDNKEISEDEFKKISPNDIESIQVLKEDEISIKYGIKAKNGVLIIKTKDYQKNTSTHKKTSEIEKKRNALAEKNQSTIENKKAEIEKRKAIIEERKALAENRKSTIENKRAEIENKKAEIEKRKAIIEERKALAENRKSTIENKRAEIERQKAILEERKALAEKKKSLDLLSSIFNNTKEIKKDQEDDDFKITSISASLTQEDGTIITMSENY